MAIKALFGVWDYVVLSVVLIISAGIGVYYRFTGGKQKTAQVSKAFVSRSEPSPFS